ncbi:MAG: hypothetical protein ACSHXI_11435 [Hoeflea sp.]|uniref:hypothetical protein n=1 Tax=Hoeflea sp. TaxID=1940281 RepID=UPI003EFB396A
MNFSFLVVCSLIGISLAGTSAVAGETVTTNQSNAINIRVIAQVKRSDDTNYVVNQTGLYNSVAAVSFGSGGYTAIYQDGQANRAAVHQFGRNRTTVIDQLETGQGIFSQFGSMSR